MDILDVSDEKEKCVNATRCQVIAKSFLFKETIKNPQENPRFGKRHIQTFCLFLSLSVSLTVRAQLSITIVAMTDILPKDMPHNHEIINAPSYYLNKTEIINGGLVNSRINYFDRNVTVNLIEEHPQIFRDEDEQNNLDIFENQHDQNVTFGDSDVSNNHHLERATIQSKPGWSVYRTYNWSKSTQEMITGSFFVGYTAMQLPMGILAQKFGGKLPVLVSLLVNGVLSIITPWAAIIGWQYVCSCRLLQGMTQAALYPSMQTMLGKWAPVSERGRLTTFIINGSQFGTIVAFQLAGFLAGSPSLGWPFSFWVSGALSLACGALLAALGAATPADHPTISAAEKHHIMGHDDEELYQSKRKTPWKNILSSTPVWAMVATYAGATFGYIFIFVQMPIYMSKILHVNITNNGLFSSLPYIAMYGAGIVSGQLSDFFINHGYVSVINARRIANSIGMVVSGVMMVGAAFTSSVPVAVTLLVLSKATHAGMQVGSLINQIDLAPNFAGTLMSLANLVGNFASLGAPVLVSLIVTNAENQHHWQIVFLITAAIMIITNCIFIAFIKVDVQPWNDTKQTGNELLDEFSHEKLGFLAAHKKTEDNMNPDHSNF